MKDINMKRDYSSTKGVNNGNYKTGYAVRSDNKKRPSFYNIWQNMKARCLNPNHPKYHRYGGRGIKVCNEWLDIKGFSEWALNNGWEDGLSIDRINNDGNYCPENCQWITLSENSKKKSTTKLTKKDVIEMRKLHKDGYSINKIAKMYNVCFSTSRCVIKDLTHIF